ncbi:MAG: putative O-glycosylation ligase, exosortase A system-associated [Gammaproteobacteria bacterium]|nr:putative O-glycosylation ligase, exosortase A system-associated [Gammaproteobacteria bacterium]
MRDLLITLFVFGAIPFILRQPFYGVLMWTWLGLGNMHRLAWGFAVNMPFALIVFLATLLGFLFLHNRPRTPLHLETVLLAILLLWMFICTTFAVFPEPAWEQWSKVWRIQLGVLLTLLLVNSRQRIHLLVGVMAVSIGFYGVKGGIFTLLGGGANHVWGPQGSFIAGNNEIGLALLMTIPLLWYLARFTAQPWARWGLYASAMLSFVAVVGTQSRGAFVGMAVMGLMMFLKVRRKLLPLVFAVGFIALLPMIAPQAWFDRMHTIQNYEQDASAMGRIGAWKKSIEIAGERLTGGGFRYLAYGYEHDAHSIYFQVLAEEGYPGLLLFLAILVLAWRRGSRIQRLARGHPELDWAGELAAMLQVSLTGYCTAGAFLGLAYFDFFYVLLVCLLVLEDVVVATLKTGAPAVAPPLASNAARRR